ncbi:MAG: SLATT domain-containing protein [Bacilli bacterium]|nr:SLATT domain-containing protein [Bacilli bacterium]
MAKSEAEFANRKNAFINKVSKTKYCRINAYKRCCEWRSFLVFLSFIYNIGLVVISILSISLLRDAFVLNVIVAILSVVVFAISLFVSSLDYGRKANEYCRCYQALEELIRETNSIDSLTNLCNIEEKYNTILSFSINHDECDYWKLISEYPNGYQSFICKDDGTVLSEEEAKKECDSFNKSIKKKYNEYLAKKIVFMLVLTGFIFYPLYIGIVKLIRRKK